MDAMREKKPQNCFPVLFIILFLPFLFVVGILSGYLGLVPLKVETHTLVMIVLIFLIFIAFVKHNANYVVCNMRASFFDMETRLQEHVKSHMLDIMGKSKSTISVDGFLEEYYRDMRNDNFASVATTVFPMLGILGTFISIAISMPDFTSQSSEALDSEITTLLAGVGTAFYVSVYGIFLSLLWMFFEKRGLSKIEHDAISLNKLYEKHIWSDSELKLHIHTISESRDEKLVGALKETFNIDFVKSLNETYLENFKSIIDTTSTSFSSMTHDLQKVSDDLSQNLKDIHYSNNALQATIQIDETLKGFDASTNALKESVKDFDDHLAKSMERSFEKIDNEVADIVVKLADFASSVANSSDEVRESMERYHKEVITQIAKVK
jgi:biopolymer transport protein ExbB/TolQ